MAFATCCRGNRRRFARRFRGTAFFRHAPAKRWRQQPERAQWETNHLPSMHSVPMIDRLSRDGLRETAEVIQRLCPGAVVRCGEPLARRTTMRVGGPADFHVEPGGEEELAALLKFCDERRMPFFVLGRGSNLLVKDGGFRGMVISLARPHFSRVEVHDRRLHCGAGAKLKAVAVEAKRSGLAGLEFLEGIPGSVGGALRMNAGAMGGGAVRRGRFGAPDGLGRRCPRGKVKRVASGISLLRHVEKTHRRERGAARKSGFERGHRGTHAPVQPETLGIRSRRRRAQVAFLKTCRTIPAGQLVDELGLKGARVGGAVGFPRTREFYRQRGSATAARCFGIDRNDRQRAQAERGIELETEVEIIGE